MIIYLRARNVTTGGSETFGESSHLNIDVSAIDTKIVCNSPPMRSNGANAMRFVQVKVGVVLLLESNDFWKIDNRALHTTIEVNEKLHCEG